MTTPTIEVPTKKQGLSLADIGPVYEDIEVGADAPLRVYGISAKGLFAIFQRYPEIGQWFNGGKVVMSSLVTQVPDAIAGIIATACGFPADVEMEAKAESIPVDSQIDVLEAIFRLTFKNGFGPFVLRIVALSAEAESVNYGRGMATTSQKASPPASEPVTTPNPSGT